MANRADDIWHFRTLRQICLKEIATLEEEGRKAYGEVIRFKTLAREREIARLRYSAVSYENWLRDNGAQLSE